MTIQNFIGDEVLNDISGRLKFGNSRIEERLGALSEPKPKTWSYPTHQMDDIAETFGLKGFEFKALQDAAMQELSESATLQHFYRQFLMAAKLICSDAVEKVRSYEQRISEEKNFKDTSYQEKLRQYTNHKNKLINGWQEVRKTIHTRWGRIGRGLAKMLEKNASMGSMGQRDQYLIDLLAGRGIAKTDIHPDINQRRVLRFDWDAYYAMSIEDIAEVIYDLESISDQKFMTKLKITQLDDTKI